MHLHYYHKQTQQQNPKSSALGILLLVVLVVVLYSILQTFSSVSISEERIITIPEGYTVSETISLLDESGLIRSPLGFRLSSYLDPLVVKSGSYHFEPGAHRLWDIRERLATADYGDVYVSITIPEGSTIQDISDILANSDLDIDTDTFLRKTQGKEGYLFPDTYFFLPGDDEYDVIEKLEETFEDNIQELEQELGTQVAREDIVTMASIIEKEAGRSLEEMRMVSGILWKRIEVGMPLQVDAPFLFTLGKTSAQLTLEDLRTDGPYNTYTNLGLPPTPIVNPGLDALTAAMDPLESLYFFYLHDTNGNIHYGVTHDDHVRNKNRYLR